MTMIEVDDVAAALLMKADTVAKARGESLGVYLQQSLPPEIVAPSKQTQLDAWNAFVAAGTAYSLEHLPPGYVADDSREAMYDDRS